jgi:hypothetical protein
MQSIGIDILYYYINIYDAVYPIQYRLVEHLLKDKRLTKQTVPVQSITKIGVYESNVNVRLFGIGAPETERFQLSIMNYRSTNRSR